MAPDFSSINVSVGIAIANKEQARKGQPFTRLLDNNLVYGQRVSSVVRLANLLIIIALTAMTFVFLLLAAPVERLLGETGLMVVSRILGLLLLAIAASTIISALGAAFPGLSG
jgi:small neutral amino acid transporter SnatA (MarC family)